MAPLRIGMFGGGTVGGGVYEIVEATKKALLKSLGADVSIVKICVRNVGKARSFTMLDHTSLVTDYDDILEDDSINCVLELMGGTTSAKDVVFKALLKGKSVITANKALLAEYVSEVQQALVASPQAKLGYEAAVCGGIPIINTLQQDFLGDSISKVEGIMNGTTNFMLTKMESGAAYDEVLKEAQDLGYAEADPTADVGGFDVQAKIALLAKLAFGPDVPLAQVPCKGISALTSTDFAFAKNMGCTIKLTGTAMKAEDKLSVFVSPVMVPLQHPLATARGAGNMVVIDSFNLTQSTFSGPGAGRYPTANSVVNDIIRLSNGSLGAPFPFHKSWTFDADFSGCFYVRAAAKATQQGVLGCVGKLAAKRGVSINQVLNSAPQRRGGASESQAVS